MKLLIKFSYDGSKFCGFQRQNDLRSVQKDLEQVLSNIYNEDIFIKGAGRTDRGVHAYNQAAHIEVPYIIKDLKSKLNNSLEDIHINSIKKVSDDFHARYSPKYKIYEYRISLKDNVDTNYYLYYYKKTNLKEIKKTSKLFLGTHDYRNFVSGERKDYVSTIYSIDIKLKKNILYIRFKGIAFYKYMIRNIVGALLDVGSDKVSYEEVKEMLENYEVRRQLSTAIANGLYLIDVKY